MQAINSNGHKNCESIVVIEDTDKDSSSQHTTVLCHQHCSSPSYGESQTSHCDDGGHHQLHSSNSSSNSDKLTTDNITTTTTYDSVEVTTTPLEKQGG